MYIVRPFVYVELCVKHVYHPGIYTIHFYHHIQTLQERIKRLENAQGSSVEAMLSRITLYGSRRQQDFDKYQALRLAEELVSVAKTTNSPKPSSYDVIATTLREKIGVPNDQFKAYSLALLVDKEYTRIFDAISKIDKSFHRSTPYTRPPGRYNERPSVSGPRVVCYHCGTPGHKSLQCWKLPASSRSAGGSSRGGGRHSATLYPFFFLRLGCIDLCE
jgi:hypothetical protein